jgi:hypothetical protein
MAVRAFISYSHADEKALERLHKHLAMLQRDGSLASWSDHKILPGENIGKKISAELEQSEIFIALVSPDYLASRYCYENEFQRAQQLAGSGRMRIIPLIIEPCDWLASPFSEYLALPKDGKPVSEWANQNNAYLDAVTGLRRIIDEGAKVESREAPRRLVPEPSRKPRIKHDFDTIQRREFAEQAYEAIRDYFEASCRELNGVGDGTLKAKFEKMDETAFTCTVVNRAKRSGSEADITVRNAKGRRHHDSEITYVYEPFAEAGTSNGSIRVDADDYQMFLTLDVFGFSRAEGENRYTFERAAEILWVEFVKQAGIDYD